MGYTRYWYMGEGTEFSDEFLVRVKEAFEYAETKCRPSIKICGPYGYGKPIVTKHGIYFNGSAELGQDYETCEINFADDFNFCKTKRLPYDCVVNAVLKLAKTYGYISKVMSDGENDEARARRIYKHISQG